MTAPRLVVVSGPSGVGKTTVCKELCRRPGFELVVTATTRDPRPGEERGIHYHFLAEAEFRRRIAEGGFLEWADVYGSIYGTPRDQVEAALAARRNPVLNIDVQGARSVRTCGLPSLLVFLLPPSREELEARLRGRGTDAQEVIQKRLASVGPELACQDEFDLKVTNDRVENAVEAIVARLESE